MQVSIIHTFIALRMTFFSSESISVFKCVCVCLCVWGNRDEVSKYVCDYAFASEDVCLKGNWNEFSLLLNKVILAHIYMKNNIFCTYTLLKMFTLNNKETIWMPTQALINLHYKERRVDLWRSVRYEDADVNERQTSSNQYSLFTQIVLMH